MGRLGLVIEIRRLRQEAPRGTCVDVAIAEGLRAGGWTVDDVDRAQQIEQQRIDDALAQRQSESGHSAAVCDECGEEIPEARRQAVEGCTRCVGCQEAVERMRW